MAGANSLERVMGFSAADLEANRRGQLSQAQVERMKRERGRSALVASILFFGLGLGAASLFFLGQLQGSLILHGAGAMLTVINAAMVFRAGRAYMRVGVDLRVGGIEALAGVVERVLRRSRGGRQLRAAH